MALFGAPPRTRTTPSARCERRSRSATGRRRAGRSRCGSASPPARRSSRSAHAGEGEGWPPATSSTPRRACRRGAGRTAILVGETTYRATGEAIEYERREPVDAKGKADAGARLGGGRGRGRGSASTSSARPAAARRPRPRARLARRRRSRARASEREPQLVTLVGVPGIGKSRLVCELFRVGRRTIPSSSSGVRAGRSRTATGSPTGRSARSSRRRPASSRPTPRTRRGEARAGRRRRSSTTPSAAGSSGHLRPLVGPRRRAELGGDRRARRSPRGAGSSRRSRSDGPLVLVFEDLHWADDALLDFVDHLVDWATGVPLLVLCDARPELLERRPGWGGGKRERADALARRRSRTTTRRGSSPSCSTARSCRPRRRRRCSRTPGEPAVRRAVRADARGARPDASWRCPRRSRASSPRASTPSRPRRSAAPGRRRGREGVLARSARRVGRRRALGGRGAPARARAEGVRPARAALLRRRRERVRVPARARARRRVRADPARASAPRSTAWPPSGSSRSRTGPRITPRCSPTTTRARSSTRCRGPGHGRPRRAGASGAARCRRRSASLFAFADAARHYGAALELWPPDDPERAKLQFAYASSRNRSEGGGAELLEEARDRLLAAGERPSQRRLRSRSPT